MTDNYMEKELITLVKDFDSFIDFVERHSVQLTKAKGFISRKYLPDINNRMTVRNETATGYTEQDFYPYIHLFYYLSLSGRLLMKESRIAGKLYLSPTERLQLYKELTYIEKYYFLLETFWVDLDWAGLFKERQNPLVLSLQELFFILGQEEMRDTIFLSGNGKLVERVFSNCLDEWNHFLLYFDWFGFWECEINQERVDRYYRKSWYFAKSLKVTTLGKKVIPILLVERNFQIWNIPERKRSGEVNPIPGAILEDMMFVDIPQEVEDMIYERMQQDQSSQQFFTPFKHIYPDQSLLRTLPRNKIKFINGTYTFKISFTKAVWREVVLSGNHTMEDLHDIILNAFDFDDDHLYSFFMDGKKWSDDCVTSPYDDYGYPQANKVRIGDLALECGQRFLYLYDFGDEWMFTVEVVDIQKNEREPFKPLVKVRKGEAPSQYGEDENW